MSNIIIVFDTETTGFSPEKNEIVQLSYILYDVNRQSVLYATKLNEDIVKINGKIPKNTSDVHGITKDMTLDKRPIKDHIDQFIKYCDQANRFVGHNIKFDIKMITGQIKKIMNESMATKTQPRIPSRGSLVKDAALIAFLHSALFMTCCVKTTLILNTLCELRLEATASRSGLSLDFETWLTYMYSLKQSRRSQ